MDAETKLVLLMDLLKVAWIMLDLLMEEKKDAERVLAHLMDLLMAGNSKLGVRLVSWMVANSSLVQ